MFLDANIDIPPTMPTGAKEMKSANQYLPAILLLALSIFCLTPTLTRADQQSTVGKITIDVAGQATAIGGNGASGATTLNLTAKAYKNSDQWLIIQNITGALQIGSAKFSISGGQGSVSIVGAIAIFADTPTKKGQLILHGTLNGNSITFGTPSQLLSTAYLNLSGSLNGLENIPTASETTQPQPAITTGTGGTVQSATTSSSQNQHVNSTSSLSTSEPQNTTIHSANTTLTKTMNTTSAITSTTAVIVSSSSYTLQNGTSNVNGTKQHTVTIHVVQGQGEICLSSRDQMPLCTTTTQTVTISDGELVDFDSTPNNGFTWDHYDGLGSGQGQNFNTIITQDNTVGAYFKPTSTSGTSATAAISLPTSNLSTTSYAIEASTATPIGNTTQTTSEDVTVTVTQYVNQTVSVTHTVAYHTVSYTVTSTVALTTITRGNVISTTSETTTVSTTTGP